jgi:xanthine dehydrogenase accessory factor
MREIALQLRDWLERGEQVALGTLVHVQKSAPRLPGAHCAVTASGEIAGAISAGCVESDLFEWSQSVLATGEPKLVSYDVSDSDAMRIGLTCGGAIEVLLEPLAAHSVAWSAVLADVAHDKAAASAVAIAPPPLLGRRLFLVGEATGSIEPSIDAQIEAALREQIAAGGGSRNLELPLGDQTARIFVEAIAPPPRLVVVGATQTALPLCRMAKELDFHVTVVDPREVYSSRERLAEADVVVREWPDAAFARVPLDAAYVVTLTHDEKFDLPSLRAALRSTARYIGALGSRRTHAKRVEALRAEGFGDADIARIHAPVGLDLGGRAPAEIALAVLAEIVAVRFGRDPRGGTGAKGEGRGAGGEGRGEGG